MAVNRPKNPPKKKKVGGESLFQKIEGLFRMEAIFDEGVPVKYLPYMLFVMVLLLTYIGNNHYGEKTHRKVQRLEQEVEDLRADYTTLKADYMYSSKQSEVARRVEPLGLVESQKPPFKIIVEDNE